MITREDPALLRVVIAGGGVAALEAALALHDLAGDRVAVTLLAPEEDFVLRPMLVARPFAKGEMLHIPLARVAAETGLRLVHQTLARVDAADREIVTTEGGRLQYDALIVAVGARPVPVYSRALTFAAGGDPHALNGLLRDLEEGRSHRVAFVAPPGFTWTLPLYELAVMTARQVRGMGIDDVQIDVVTPEGEPLEEYGQAASADVQRLLQRWQIELHCDARARQEPDGTLVLEPSGTRIEGARIVALPVLQGPRVAGLPHDEQGFLAVDAFGRVLGAEGVFAAGDITDCPLKQGGLAAQQADSVAQAIALEAGVEIEPTPFAGVLRGTLMTGGQTEHHLRSTEHGVGVASDHMMWWPPGKVAGRYLTPFLAGEAGERLTDLPPFAHA